MKARKDDTFSSSSAVYVNGSFHFGWVSPPPVGPNSQGRHIYCSPECVALTPLLGQLPPWCAWHLPGEEFAQRLGHSGFSVALGPCSGTST